MTATWRILEGDCRDTLRTLPDRSVQTVVTSPPYFGLRDYGTGEWEGGDEACDHARQSTVSRASSGLGVKDGRGPYGDQFAATQGGTIAYRDECGKCGARRVDRQIGLEPTPDEFVATLVEVFREVRRVLRDDGTVWLNLGDSYNNRAVNRPSSHQTGLGFTGEHLGTAWRDHAANGRARMSIQDGNLKEKDLLGVPWMVAFALRADGWVLRSEIVWNKPNPMPESVTDRPTKAHEQLFLFSKARWTGAEEPLLMRDVDAAWLAALVDGEGSICFQDRTSERAGQATYSVRLSIVNTNRALLERVETICGLAGVGSPSPRTRSSGESGRPIYAWQVTNAKAARVIAAIRPYLIAKATQADLALYVQALNRKHTGRGGHTVSHADQEAKVKAAAACSALNRGQDVDLAWFRPVKPGRWVSLPYAYDADAIREGLVEPDRPTDPYEAERFKNGRGSIGVPGGYLKPTAGARNRRSVWTVATQPYAGSHFAVFPAKLIEPCILAGSSPKACGECGAPWRRVVDVERRGESIANPAKIRATRDVWGHGDAVEDGRRLGPGIRDTRRAVGWEPSCSHHDDTGHCVVLDMFAGSGTTGMVALRHGRSFIGCELSPEYVRLARDRIIADSPLLNTYAEEAA